MKKKILTRVYKFSDSKLVETVKEKVAFINRDLNEFQEFGVTSDELIILEKDARNFAEGSTDIEEESEQVEATSEKVVLAGKLREKIEDVMMRVELTFGTGSAKYRKFGTEALSKQTDSELYFTAKRVVKVGTEDLDLYAAKGLKQESLNELNGLAEEFLVSKTNQSIEVSNRDIEQEERVKKGNSIYNRLVKLTNLGQQIWDSKSPAKFNDYVLYNTPSGTQEENNTPAG